jgi:flagellin-specific chaperone FliS
MPGINNKNKKNKKLNVISPPPREITIKTLETRVKYIYRELKALRESAKEQSEKNLAKMQEIAAKMDKLEEIFNNLVSSLKREGKEVELSLDRGGKFAQSVAIVKKLPTDSVKGKSSRRSR